MGEMPLNIVFAPAGDPQTIEQMIASTERGILVTRLWYIREVEPFEKVVDILHLKRSLAITPLFQVMMVLQ